jgi:large subunit ribosomal protein L23
MKSIHDVIIRPIVTERSMAGAADRKYTFAVNKKANKHEIAAADEALFGVKVEKVNTMNVRGKKKRLSYGRPEGTTAAWKKAIVQVTEDSKTIEFFDSLM